MNKSVSTDVLIIGGGLVGASLGIALASAGVRSLVVDRTAPEAVLKAQFDGRTSALAFGTRRLYEATGVWDYLHADAQPIRHIRVADGTSPFFVHFDHACVSAEEPMGYIAENLAIRRALHKTLACYAGLLDYRAPCGMTALDRRPGTVSATLDDGTGVSARLAVAADGRGSPTREAAGIRLYKWDYHQSGIVCSVAHTVPHNGVAVEHFQPAGPFAILPLTGNRSGLVWTEKKDRVNAFMSLDDAAFLDEIRSRFDGYLGELELIGPRFCYPLSLQHAYTYISERLALVGDAAHGMHPIAGQGFNMGLRDVAVLAEVLGCAKRLGLDLGSRLLLQDYERKRRADNTLMLAATDLLNRLFSNNIPPVKAARDLGLGLVNRLTPLKRAFVKHAMGQTGRVPKLMRGERI